MWEYRRSSKKNIRCQPLSSISERIFRNSLLDRISFRRYFTVICFQSNYDNEQNIVIALRIFMDIRIFTNIIKRLELR